MSHDPSRYILELVGAHEHEPIQLQLTCDGAPKGSPHIIARGPGPPHVQSETARELEHTLLLLLGTYPSLRMSMDTLALFGAYGVDIGTETTDEVTMEQALVLRTKPDGA